TPAMARSRTRRSACSTIRARWCAGPQYGRCRNCWHRRNSPRWQRRLQRRSGTRASSRNGASQQRTGRSLDFDAENPAWSPDMTAQPFFTRHRDDFIPTSVANGPWDPKSLHGRVVIGLLAFVIEQRHGGADFVPARLTVDMFRLPNIDTPIEVRTKSIR